MDNPQYRIAVVEDETSLRQDLVDFFLIRGMQAFGFASAEDFFAAVTVYQFDLAVLDVGLPGKDGISAALLLRQQSNMPIIILTSNATNDVHLESLNAGVDMFLSKTASLEIIESSVRNLLSRVALGERDSPTEANSENSAEALRGLLDEGVWHLLPSKLHLIAPNYINCRFTHMETLLLRCLFTQPNQAVTRLELLNAINRQETVSNMRNLDTYINRIRRKCVEATALEIPIQAAYSMGYIFTGNAKLQK